MLIMIKYFSYLHSIALVFINCITSLFISSLTFIFISCVILCFISGWTFSFVFCATFLFISEFRTCITFILVSCWTLLFICGCVFYDQMCRISSSMYNKNRVEGLLFLKISFKRIKDRLLLSIFDSYQFDIGLHILDDTVLHILFHKMILVLVIWHNHGILSLFTRKLDYLKNLAKNLL